MLISPVTVISSHRIDAMGSPNDTPSLSAIEAAPYLTGRRLVIRADGDARIGMGHVMRCLALAEAWIAFGGSVRLACTAVPPSVAERYHDLGAEVALHDRWPPDEVLDGADAVVADGLGISDADLADFAAGATLAVIDDMAHRTHYPAAVIVNQNLHATPDLYAGKTDAQLCLGPSHALLRREFRASANHEIREEVAEILVLLGGADPKGYSRRVLEAVSAATDTAPHDPEILLLVGAANPARADLERRASLLPGRILVRHDVRDMAGLFGRVDLAVSAAGSTVLEMAALGVPMIIAAQNESEIGPAAALARYGAAIDAGPLDRLDPGYLEETVAALIADPDTRRRMSQRAQALVNGDGAARVAACIAAQLATSPGSTPSS
jgi:UDP-2,4-diacetamido-2,4,6-trideoxy-beta-L-altropyranose hydrolase